MFKNKWTNISAIARNLNIKAHGPIKFKEEGSNMFPNE